MKKDAHQRHNEPVLGAPNKKGGCDGTFVASSLTLMESSFLLRLFRKFQIDFVLGGRIVKS